MKHALMKSAWIGFSSLMSARSTSCLWQDVGIWEKALDKKGKKRKKKKKTKKCIKCVIFKKKYIYISVYGSDSLNKTSNQTNIT